jgi:hypothetical protein
MSELALLPTYTEVSPSGTGYKQFCRGTLPDGKPTKPGSQSEMYDGKPSRERYFAITGVHLPGTPTDIRELGDALRDSYLRMLAFDLAEAFRRRGMLRERKEGKQLVRCPWAETHHGDDEAALFKKRGRKGGYNFRCLHSHCASRTVADVYTFFGFVEDDENDTRHKVFVGGDLHLKIWPSTEERRAQFARWACILWRMRRRSYRGIRRQEARTVSGIHLCQAPRQRQLP